MKNKMAQYNSEMYPSLSAYVIEHAETITDKETVSRYFQYLEEVNPRVSYEYAGGVDSTQNIIDLIEEPMREWFEKNDIDFQLFFEDTNAHCQWMVCDLPNTYGYLFKNLLLDTAKKQKIL